MNTRPNEVHRKRGIAQGALVALMLVLAWAGLASRGDAQPPLAVRVVGPASPVAMGQSFVALVTVEGASNLGAYEFEFNFDPAIVSATVNNFQLGPLLSSTGRNSAALRLASSPNQPGVPLFGAYSYGDQPGPSGNGVLATVAMLAEAPGVSSLTLTRLKVTDVNGDEVSALASSGSVTVIEATVRPIYLPLLWRHGAN